MSQQSLGFGRLYLVGEAHKAAFRAVEAAAEGVGMLVAAGAAKIDESDLRKMFQPNSGRYLRLHTAMAIGAVAGIDARRAIVTPVARLFGFDIKESEPIDDREARIRLEAALRALGPVGEQALAAVYGGRR